MKKVIVFRHGPVEDLGYNAQNWALDAHLTEEGKEMMRKVALRHENLLKECTHFITSPLIRAQETLYIMMERLGYESEIGGFYTKVKFNSDLWTSYPESWLSIISDQSNTMKELYKRNFGFIEGEGERSLNSIRLIVTALRNKDIALCVSHGGPLDAGLATAKKKLGNKKAFSEMQDLQKGEGVVFVFDEENNLKEVEELRHP